MLGGKKVPSRSKNGDFNLDLEHHGQSHSAFTVLLAVGCLCVYSHIL